MERRAGTRYPVWFPMSVTTSPGAEGLAVSRNMSSSGLLMATATRLEAGAPVVVTFQLSLRDSREHQLSGRIVRVEPNRDDPEGMWPHFVAVEFDNAAPELEPYLAQLRDSGPFDD